MGAKGFLISFALFGTVLFCLPPTIMKLNIRIKVFEYRKYNFFSMKINVFYII